MGEVKNKAVVVRVTLELVISVPDDWRPNLIDFHLNGSSWCSDTMLCDLGDWASRSREARGEGAGCACGTFKGEFVRDATSEDHARLPVLSS